MQYFRATSWNMAKSLYYWNWKKEVWEVGTVDANYGLQCLFLMLWWAMFIIIERLSYYISITTSGIVSNTTRSCIEPQHLSTWWDILSTWFVCHSTYVVFFSTSSLRSFLHFLTFYLKFKWLVHFFPEWVTFYNTIIYFFWSSYV